jgi:hypothetical protein
LDYFGCLVRGETDFVKFWVEFDQNKAKEGWPKFDISKVRGLMLTVIGHINQKIYEILS